MLNFREGSESCENDTEWNLHLMFSIYSFPSFNILLQLSQVINLTIKLPKFQIFLTLVLKFTGLPYPPQKRL